MRHSWDSYVCCLVCLLYLLCCFLLTSSIKQNSFKIIKGYTLSTGTQLKKRSFKTNSAVFCSMLCNSGCGSAIYNPHDKTCVTFKEKYYEFNWTQHSDWQVLYRDEPIQYGEYSLVFRAQKEINTPLYNAWIATGQHDDRPLTSGVMDGCYKPEMVIKCKQHFRSHILDDWTNMQIKQVRMSFYVNGTIVGFIEFNGTSTTRDSWFQQSLILDSSWGKIVNDTTIENFNISGINHPAKDRRFLIDGGPHSCKIHQLYFLAVDQPNDVCETDWSISMTNYPVFIYSSQRGMANPNDFKLADVMMVYVKM